MKVRNEFIKDLQVENMELRELHFMLDKILKEKTFLRKISTCLHEIIDDMWNSSEDQFIKLSSQSSISKKEYISRFIYNVKCIDELFIEKKENINKKEYVSTMQAGIQNDGGYITLILFEDSFRSKSELKLLLSHEIGHLADTRLTEYISAYASSAEYVKGNLTLAIMWAEALAEDTANNNIRSKGPYTENNRFTFVFHDDKEIYAMSIPQNGYSNVYHPLSTVYAELKTILSVEFLEKEIPIYMHITEEMIDSIEKEIKNRELAENFIIQCISIFESLEYFKENAERIYEKEEEQEIKALYYKHKTKKVDEWNEKIQKKRKEYKEMKYPFETNFIRSQKMFFEIMGEKVKNAKTVEEVYECTKSINHIRNYLPVIVGFNGKQVTDEIIGINEYREKYRKKISELQEQGKTSIIPYDLCTDSDEVEI